MNGFYIDNPIDFDMAFEDKAARLKPAEIGNRPQIQLDHDTGWYFDGVWDIGAVWNKMLSNNELITYEYRLYTYFTRELDKANKMIEDGYGLWHPTEPVTIDIHGSPVYIVAFNCRY